MSVLEDGVAYRKMLLGPNLVSKATGTLSAATIPVFTVAGGEVLITALWLKVTTLIAGIGTLAVQNDPTTGATYVLVTATDLGTTDTTVGSVVGLDHSATAAPSFLRGGRIQLNAIATTGTIDVVGASAIDGAATINVCWVPLTVGATVVAV